jgi:methylase of polypeptide subunit release factors
MKRCNVYRTKSMPYKFQFKKCTFVFSMHIFKDNFSKQSEIYAKYRPHYPPGLYSYLSSLTPEHQVAWDCGTGSGQAAIGVSEFYSQVIATDPSEQQIKNSIPVPNCKIPG